MIVETDLTSYKVCDIQEKNDSFLVKEEIVNAISIKSIQLFEESDTHQLCETQLAKPNTMGWSLPLGDLGPVEQIQDRPFRVYDA